MASTYTLDEVLYEDEEAALYRAHAPDGHAVLAKTLKAPHPTAAEIEALRRELEAGQQIGTDAVARPEALATIEGRPALVMRDDGGVPLAMLLGHPADFAWFLRASLALTDAVSAIHRTHALHGRLHPADILLRHDGRVELTGLGQALETAQLADGAPFVPMAMWPYLSPEQTGHLGTPVDHRSDLYSLGVIFFEMLTGTRPFEAHALVGWLHAHCAIAPPSPSQRVPAVPAVVSSIVLKLLAKAPEARYQSASGLRHDLAHLSEAWRERGAVEPFAIGLADVPPPLRFATRVFGRKVERRVLEQAIERVAERKTMEVVIVGGPSGIGKTALLEDLRRTACAKGRALMGMGRCAEGSGAPCNALFEALDGVLTATLETSDESPEELCRDLEARIGADAPLLSALLPGLARVLGVRPRDLQREVPAADADRRLAAALDHFIGAFADRERTILLLLDDIQETDAATAEHFVRWANAARERPLLVVASYRHGNLRSDHLLLETTSRLADAGVGVTNLALGPLGEGDVTEWLADVLHRSPEHVAPLARTVTERSGGVPLVVTRLLESLYRRGHIRYSIDRGAWEWDLAAARAEPYADDVAPLIAHAIDQLPPDARTALSLFAAHGLRADIETLAAVLDCRETEVLARLEESFTRRLVTRVDATIYFLHERIRSVAYELLGERRAEAHLRIGRSFLARFTAERGEARAFEIVRHFRLAEPGSLSDEERTRVAQLALVAGRRAQATGQPAAATDHLIHAAGLLDEMHWRTHHDLAFSLHLALAKARFVAGAITESEALATALLARTDNPIERATVRGLLADLAFARGGMPEAMRACVEGLSALGIEIAEHPTAEEADATTARALAHLAVWARPASELPPATDPAARAACDLLAALIAPAVYVDWNLVWVAAATSVEWSLTHGNAVSSATAYSVLALRLASRGAYAEAFRLGDEAYQLARRDESAGSGGRTAFLFLSFLAYLTLPVRNVLELVGREVEAARAAGDQTHACYLQKNAVHFRFFVGDALADVGAAADDALAFAERAGFVAVAEEVRSMLWLVERLRDVQTSAPFVHDASAFDEQETLPLVSVAHCYHEVIAHFVLGDPRGAADAAERAERLAARVVGALEAAELRFYAALAYAADGRDPAGALAKVRAHGSVLHELAQGAPANFGARAALVEAEIHRLEGDDLAAERCYETAIRAARTSASVPVEAIASECAASFYRARGMTTAANAYLVEAYECYEAWGATRKTRALVQAFPGLRMRGRDETPDVESLLAAQRAISSTYGVPELQERLLAVAIEHAGAERGCLLATTSEGELVVASVAGTRADELGRPGSRADRSRVPLSLCRTALHLRKPIVLSDATEATRYAVDPYLARGKARSVLCLPIVRADQATALLYLENDLVPGMFSRARLVVLDTIAAQAAITLEKARLIAKLESENAERRRAEEKLADHKRLLEDILDATPAVVFVKDTEGRYLLVNRRFEQIFHVDRRRFCGEHDRDLFPEGKVAEFHATDRVVLSGRSVELDQEIELDDGEHAFMTTKFPLFDANGKPRAVCGVATDVTARKQAEEALRRSFSLVEATIEASDDGILVVDLAGRIVRYNRRFAEMWSIPDSILQSGDDARAIRFVLDQLQDPDAFLARVRDLYAQPKATSDDTLLLGDGRVFERHSQPHRLGPDVVGRVWSFRDMTARVRAAQERDRLLAKETRARAEAEEAVRIRDEFLSVASHELRTPLASLSLAIDGLQQLFTKKEADETSRRALGIAKRQVGRLAALVGLLLDVSRIRAGKLVLNVAEVDLRSVVREVTSLLADEMARAGSDLVLHADEPVVGRWDGVRLEQVVHNLLGNALKFGGGLPITVTVAKRDGVAELSVEDRGIGISAEFMKRIYEPFARGVSSRHYGGLGLGLYITKTIVEAHHGELGVESEEGVGSKFTVRLPLSGP